MIELTLRGTALFLMVWAANSLWAGRMRSGWRRAWWLCVPVAFLSPWTVPFHSAANAPMLAHTTAEIRRQLSTSIVPSAVESVSRVSLGEGLMLTWILGAVISFVWLIVRSIAASRSWSTERLSTDSELLELFEDCKARAGVTAPIGLVVSSRVGAPAILGWLRPRILLPQKLAESTTRDQFQHVILHELAHFRAMDVPVGWGFSAACCLHWFNPFAHWAERSWMRFREEAADEVAALWSGEAVAYGETLLALVREDRKAVPYSGLAIAESFSNLKHRLTMITKIPHKSAHPIPAFAIALVLLGMLALNPLYAEANPKDAAVAAMEQWLRVIDEGNYAKSWDEASTAFQKAATSAQWAGMGQAVRQPLGKCLSRKLASAELQKDVPLPNGKTFPGEFVVAQFDTSFENLKYAVETVTFENQGGVWKASGYYIKPKV